MRTQFISFYLLFILALSNTFAQDPPSQSVGVARLTPEVRTAINKGLEYLSKEDLQRPDGS